MILGLGRFEYYLIKLDDALLAASKTTNPALYLHKNNTRTVLFMLQALAKLYAGMHNEKKFLKLKENFKILEDALGDVDHYDAIAKEYEANKKIPRSIVTILKQKTVALIDLLNQILLKKKWINSNTLRTKKIRSKLVKMDWLEPKNEIASIKAFYIKEIKEVNAFYTEIEKPFTDIELQVHELRRKLRWLSIYAQALQGAIQFGTEELAAARYKKYLTKEIVKSPFNKLPLPGNNTATMLINKNCFLALSFTIDALGKLKDDGLKIFATKEALQLNKKITEADLTKKALSINGLASDGLNKLLTQANIICKPFFEEEILNHLIAKK